MTGTGLLIFLAGVTALVAAALWLRFATAQAGTAGKSNALNLAATATGIAFALGGVAAILPALL